MEKQKNYTIKTLKYFWQEIKKRKILLFLVLLGLSVGFIGRLVTPLFLKDLFDAVSSNDYYSGLDAVWAILLVEVIRSVSYRVGFFSLNYFETGYYRGLRDSVFSYLHKHSFEFFNNNFSGSLTKKFLAFPKAAINIFDILIFDVLSSVISLIFISVVLFYKNFYLGLGLLIWLCLVFFINFKFSKYKFKFDRLRNESDSELSGDVADTITNSSNVKLFNGYDRERKLFANLNLKSIKLNLKVFNMEAAFDGAQSVFGIILEIGILYFSLRMWQLGRFSVGDFVLLQSYVLVIIDKIWGLGNILRRLYVSFSDADEMTEILETPHEITDVPNAKKLEVSSGKIEFKNVSFNYKQTRKIFKNFNLIIEAGQRVALIGPSGAGKSTVVKLLMRNYDLDKGKVLIDGQDISRVTQDSLWQNVSLVPQDPILFHRTLKDNIAYGKEGATDEEIFAAARSANCHQFIENLPEGYDTFVGERGIKLSGGERQRVAIARAILKNSPILVLDEATSSLDSESEKLIQEALDNLMKGKTVVVIAHRLSTIKKMDRILVIDEGEVKEDGTHKSLIKLHKGTYKKLWELQAGGFED